MASCTCTDNTKRFEERQNCQVEDTGDPGVLHRDACFPLTFGSSQCARHDLGTDPRCPVNNTTEAIPDFCNEQWCYVDPDSCRQSPELVYRSTMFPGLFYSYSVCNATADNYLQYETTQSVRDKTLSVTIPIVRDKAHFKLTPEGELASSSGPEYYNDTVPWQGFMVDYFNAVVELSDMGGVKYTHRTVGADQLGLGAFTGVVHDVQAGMTDVALSTYWITSDRLQMTPYTTPVYVDQVLLWVPQPEISGGSLQDNVTKVFAPFETSLWIALGVLILVTASVNIWLSTTRGVHSYLSRRLRGSRWKKAGLFGKARIVTGMMLDSLMIFSTYFFGHSVELDWQSTRAQKVLMVGFAFLILIAVASYTANLAAFLTVTGVSNYISSMEEAIYTNTPICAHAQLKDELASVWPAATFVFNPNSVTTEGIIEDYEAGKCKVVASSMLEIRQYERYMETFCKHQLVSTGALVLENPIAFPVSGEYSGGLSYWLFRAEKQGITLQSFIDAGVPPLTCNLKLSLSDTETELASLSVENFALPMILCAACIILSIGLHFFFNQAKPSGEMADASRNTATERPRNSVSAHNPISAYDPGDADGEDDEELSDLPTIGRIGNGIGAIRDQSILEHNPSFIRRAVGFSDALPTQDTVDMHEKLQEVLATQKLMLSLIQGKVKEEAAPSDNLESDHAKNE